MSDAFEIEGETRFVSFYDTSLPAGFFKTQNKEPPMSVQLIRLTKYRGEGEPPGCDPYSEVVMINPAAIVSITSFGYRQPHTVGGIVRSGSVVAVSGDLCYRVRECPDEVAIACLGASRDGSAGGAP